MEGRADTPDTCSAHASHGGKIKNLVELLDISRAHRPPPSYACARTYTVPAPRARVCAHSCAHLPTCEDSDTPFRIEGRQGGAPATGAALAGGSRPRTCSVRAVHAIRVRTIRIRVSTPHGQPCIHPKMRQ